MIKLLDLAKNTEMELPINLAIGLGLRISEVLGLTWDNIDFEENTITVNKITSRINGSVILKEPKTESSVRKISSPKELMSLLKEYKIKQNKNLLKSSIRNNNNLLFFNKKCEPIAEDVMSKI
ncbi:phage integrase family protein [Clostridioides difficile DA00165]|nr:phage integrase family protein [Clostridioides difficile DA00165]